MTRLIGSMAAVALVASSLVGLPPSGPPAVQAVPGAGQEPLESTPSTSPATGPATAATGPVASLAPKVIRVGTYNVCNSTCGRGQFSWGRRRAALVRNVRRANPAVLAVQEANTQRWRGRRHVDDVRSRLATIGYRIASTNYNPCTRSCTRGAHIFYKPSAMHLAATQGVARAGMRGMSTIASSRFRGIQDRSVSWAFLTPNGSSATTLYVSVHLPTQKNSNAERLRRSVARSLRPWANRLIQRSGLSGVNLVIAGDLNSFSRRQPNGAQRILSQTGMIDGFEAPSRVNAGFGTVNYTPSTNRYHGFPPRPHRYRGISPARIDYVFATVRPVHYEVVLMRTRSGGFDNSYRASDHNLVVVDLPLG